MSQSEYVRRFSDIRLEDVALVGGKRFARRLYSALSALGIRVPNGFAITAKAYRDALTAANADLLHSLLDKLDKTDVACLKECAAKARAIVYQATASETLRTAILQAYQRLEKEYGGEIAVAVRSSATAEDLPNASFAGQHESFLNVRGADALFEACRRLFCLHLH